MFETHMPHAENGNVIGLFGGSFNPPHEGHMLVAKRALQALGLDQLWWMVTPGNPLKNHADLLPLKERLQKSAELIDDPRIKVTGFEQTIKSYKSVTTISYILQHNVGVHFVWIMGADSLATFHRWHRWRDIVKMVPIAVIDRPTAPMSALSSPMARTFMSSRVNEKNIAALPLMAPPAWSYLHGRLSNASSTQLRLHNLEKH